MYHLCKAFIFVLLLLGAIPLESFANPKISRSDQIENLLDEHSLLEVASIGESLNTLPDNHLLVSVGRTLAPISEYLRQKYPERAIAQIPLSGMRERSSKNNLPFSRDEIKVLHNHFDRYLENLLSKKEYSSLVLFDFANSGTTLRELKAIFADYINQKKINPKPNIKVVALIADDRLPYLGFDSHFAVLKMKSVNKSKLAFHIVMGYLSDFAPIKEFDVNQLQKNATKSAEDLSNETNPKYQEMKKTIENFLSNNPNIHVSGLDRTHLKFMDTVMRPSKTSCSNLIKTLSTAPIQP